MEVSILEKRLDSIEVCVYACIWVCMRAYVCVCERVGKWVGE